MQKTKVTPNVNTAISLFHSRDPKGALEMFQTLIKETLDIVEKTDLNLWISACHLKLQNIKQAEKIVDQVIRNIDSDQPEHKRALRQKADIHLVKSEYKQAFEIYKNLVKNESDYRELEHLQYLIDDAEENYGYYLAYGTLPQWKIKLVKRVYEILKKINQKNHS